MGFSFEVPKQTCFFLPFYGFICENLEFPSVKSSKIFTANRILLDKNFEDEESRVCKGKFFDFCKCLSFTAAKKTGVIDFPRAPTEVKHLLPVTEGNARKFTVGFAFCAHVDVMKYRKTPTFSFERAQITSAFVLSARAIAKIRVIYHA